MHEHGAYDTLFEPVQIGSKVAPNRLWQAPHASGFGTDFASVHADPVVLVGQRRAEARLYKELVRSGIDWDAAGIESVYRIGDCERPSFIADAIFSGHRLAREIDSENPAEPLPFVRDRRVVGASELDYSLGGRLSLPLH